MFPTTEVRWFHQGELPSSWLSWFENCPGPWRDEPVRTDKYLLFGDFDRFGIKVRQGCLDIKQRLESLGIIQISERVQGLVEHWTKWSFELSENADYLSDFERTGSKWISVRKWRKLRRYQLSKNGLVIGVSDTIIPPQSCGVELTEIRSGEQKWWSLAYEADGVIHSSQDVLLTISRCLFEVEGAPKLTAWNSFGYPKWLVELDR